MSSRSSRASKITEDEIINNLILKLQPLLPQNHQRRNGTVPASEILKETCNYVKRLQSEASELSERLSQLMDSMDSNGVDINVLFSNLLQQ